MGLSPEWAPHEGGAAARQPLACFGRRSREDRAASNYPPLPCFPFKVNLVPDGLQVGSFGAGAPAPEVVGCVAGVLVVEGLAPAQGPGGGQWAEGRISWWSSPWCLAERFV
jgi:hypothetical protein